MPQLKQCSKGISCQVLDPSVPWWDFERDINVAYHFLEEKGEFYILHPADRMGFALHIRFSWKTLQSKVCYSRVRREPVFESNTSNGTCIILVFHLTHKKYSDMAFLICLTLILLITNHKESIWHGKL